MATYTQLQVGSSGDYVKKMQQALVDQGYSVGSYGVDGVFGKDTKAAVTAYQTDNGLKIDGIAGDETLGHLYGSKSTTNTPSQNTQTTTSTYNDVGALTELSSAYDQQLQSLYDQYVERPGFSYDVNGDALYQQYRDLYAVQGQLAMLDTMGQAAALTGGYGNTYAQNAGQQAYQSYLQQLNGVIPELYSLAYDRYQAEGDALLDRYSMLEDMADGAYSRYRDQVDSAYDRQQDSYSNLATLIASTGYNPTDAELAAAGMTRTQANALRSQYWKSS